MGHNSCFYGIPHDKNRDAVMFAKWRKNWHLHDLIESTFDGKDEGGFMAVTLDLEQLDTLIASASAKPDVISFADLTAFKLARDMLAFGKFESFGYYSNW